MTNREPGQADEMKLETADAKLESAADKLEQTAEQAAAEGGLKAKVAPVLARDAEFLRKLKPSLIVARARGEAPTNGGGPGTAQLGPRPTPGDGSGGPNPFVVVGIALVAGIVLAKIVDWRGHAHPRF